MMKQNFISKSSFWSNEKLSLKCLFCPFLFNRKKICTFGCIYRPQGVYIFPNNKYLLKKSYTELKN
jgi:hypothetical protein